MKRHVLQRYRGAPSPVPARVATAPDPIVRNGDGISGYPGAKNAPGVWHTIINNIPPHDCLVECFAGSAAVTRRILPATSTIVIDSDAAAHAGLVELFRPKNSKLIEQFGLPVVGAHEAQLGSVRVIHADAVSWLAKNHGSFSPRTVVYCDPPYLADVRADPERRYYAQEFRFKWQHEALLLVLLDLKVPCLISGRRCDLYDRHLVKWRRVDYQTSTHGGPFIESLWCNFPEPDALHDYRFLGRNFRERERIKRKLSRWRARLQKMPVLERRVISAALAKSGDEGLTPDLIAKNGDASSPP